jgi:ribonuclease P protein component
MLARKHRIPTEKFPAVTRGKVVQNELFRAVITKDPALTCPKCAVIVSNKLAKTAVVRNRLRRQVYAALGDLLSRLPTAYVSVFPKKNKFTIKEIKENLESLLCSKK